MKIILSKCSFNECSELVLICKWVFLNNVFKIWRYRKIIEFFFIILKKMLEVDKFNLIIVFFILECKILKYFIDLLCNK